MDNIFFTGAESSSNVSSCLPDSSLSTQDLLSGNGIQDAAVAAVVAAERERTKKEGAALRQRRHRQAETEEQRMERRRLDAQRKREKRFAESEEERAERRKRGAIRARIRRQAETEQQKAERRRLDALRARQRRYAETEEQRALRRRIDAEKARLRRCGMLKSKNKAPASHEEVPMAEGQKHERHWAPWAAEANPQLQPHQVQVEQSLYACIQERLQGSGQEMEELKFLLVVPQSSDTGLGRFIK